MTAAPVIDARGASKRYALYARPGDLLREALLGGVRHRTVVALDDVTFRVRPGEALGVLGRNGAGKSTLLKLIAGTLEPSSGSIAVDGRVSAILELGTGFDPQQSGAANVRMGGLCLGLSEREIRRRFDAIVDFAELRDCIDLPLRTYSTGMVARLAFAVAMAVEPEIMIVDEALAVGDARFQLRCADRFMELRRRGCTLVLVSHSTEQVAAMCDRAIVLEGGRLLVDATAAEATRRYHQILFGGGLDAAGAVGPAGEADGRPQGSVEQGAGRSGGEPSDADPELDEAFAKDAGPGLDELNAGTRMGHGGAAILGVSILDRRGRDVRRLVSGRTYVVRFEVESQGDHEDLVAGFLFRDRSGQTIYGLDTGEGRDLRFSSHDGETLRIGMPFTCHLGPGEYFLSFGIGHADGRKLDYCGDAVRVEVPLRGGIYHASRVDLDGRLEIERIGAAHRSEAILSEHRGAP